jgi:hypothetical protein
VRRWTAHTQVGEGHKVGLFACCDTPGLACKAFFCPCWALGESTAMLQVRGWRAYFKPGSHHLFGAWLHRSDSRTAHLLRPQAKAHLTLPNGYCMPLFYATDDIVWFPLAGARLRLLRLLLALQVRQTLHRRPYYGYDTNC